MSKKEKKGTTKGKAKCERKPKLRFPEFRNQPPWVEKPLGVAATLIREKAGERECVLLSITSGVGLVSQEEKFGRTIAGKSYKNYYVIHRNDFAYNKSATKEYPQGFIAKYEGDDVGSVPNSIFTCFRVDEQQIDPNFLNYFFVGNYHGRWLKKYITVGARAHGALSIGDDDLLSMPIPRPLGESTILEQQKIADCLSSLDELIAAHSRKLETLKAHKQGLMQQLFPRKGETVPRLRFPEFEDAPEWEVKKAGSLFAQRKMKGEDGLPIYSVTINDGMVKRSNFDRNFYDIQDATGNKKVCKNDIAYNMMRMWQGACGVAIEDCMVSPAYVVLAPCEGVCSEFFYYLFKLPDSLQLLTAHSRGLTSDRLRLYFDDFAAMKLWVPALKEQVKIADCLTSTDDSIAAHTQKLDVLKTHKKGLMLQLFPSLEGSEA